MFVLLVSLFTALVSPDTVAIESVPADSVVMRTVQVNTVRIVGNRKTNERIILREMDTETGDVVDYEELVLQLKTDRERIYNTRLFNSVSVTILPRSEIQVDILVEVHERWYTFPAPILELVDRNFNDWWVNENHELSRINYGLTLYKLNVRGRNETLKLIAQFGFTRSFGINYEIPYIDNAQKSGLEFNFSYSENYSIPIRTVEHKREFLEGEGSILSSTRASLTYRYRGSFYDYHYLDVRFRNSVIGDTIQVANENYFASPDSDQSLLSIGYSFRKDHRDVIAYPLHGYKLDLSIRKVGLGVFKDVNFASIFANFSKYTDLGKGYYLSNHSAIYANTTNKISYNNYYGLGYGVYFVRGYELYVVEGPRFALNKTTFKKRIFYTNAHMDWMPLEQFNRLPIEIYLKAYFDMGYVSNYDNYEVNDLFTERLLYGYGFGLDFVTWYDVVFRTEYSFNHLGENRFFLHFIKEF